MDTVKLESDQLSPQERTRCRREAGEGWNGRPVVVVAGNQPPCLVGRDYYWTTPSGKTIVNHPYSYGWPTIYHASTRRVEVGDDWLLYQRKFQSWPRLVSTSLEDLAREVKSMHSTMRPLDRLAEDLCGFIYGTWRRDPAKRQTVLAAVRAHRAVRCLANV